ncbi:MAG: DUF1656 domain-containing protein [Planctomycetota bacterium]|jgi:hypothetical protein
MLAVLITSMLLTQAPSEVPLGQVLLPPALLVAIFGFLAAWILARVCNRTRISRFFWFPPLTFLALWVMMSACIGLWFLAP